MVRQLKSRIVSDWKAMLVVFIAGGAIVWHILACQESPMAFSPDSKNLAFVTMQPYSTDKDTILQGPHAYRLMLIGPDRKLDVLETSTKDMLTGPGFSPDGKEICYLRVPLLTKETQERLNEHVKRRQEALKDVGEFKWEPPDASQPGSVPANGTDLTLPPVDGAIELVKATESAPPLPISLVFRDAKTHSVLREIPASVPFEGDNGYLFNYLLTRPEYSPDGRWVYFSVSGVVSAVDTRSGAQRYLAASARAASLSPDGKRLAILAGEGEGDDTFVLGFVQTDGSAACYYRWPKDTSLSGLAWVDSNTVAILEPKPGKEQYVHLVRPDGTTRKVITLHLDIPTGDGSPPSEMSSGELAASPDGKYFVVSLGQDVYFMKSTGQTIYKLHDNDGVFAQPTFAPDSSKVALKHLAEKSDGVDAVAYYTPKGKLITSVAVPPLPPDTTQPTE